jgi:hypothetical protein
MNDETIAPESSELNPAQGDWLLGVFVKAANDDSDFDVEIPITLLTSGFLVSGLLVGISKYFEGVGQENAESNLDMANIFSQFATKLKTSEEETASLIAAPGYIHLKQARFFTPGGSPIPGNMGVWWRGRLSKVSGFWFGSLGPLAGS